MGSDGKLTYVRTYVLTKRTYVRPYVRTLRIYVRTYVKDKIDRRLYIRTHVYVLT